MSSGGVHVTVSPDSQVIVFSGNLLKAPPLNRRGRKKWHERYFLLRANKTIEIHKSRKAAETQKSPRKVIDLRECISLELGLEYKNLQHILSLGTFKRTFFLGAPSNALMLQWGNVLEKVKNAESGETIEVLDIGLRNPRNCNAVHRVKPPELSQQFHASLSTSKGALGRFYNKGVSNSTFALSNLGAEEENGVFGKRGSAGVGYPLYNPSPRGRSNSLSTQDTYGRDHPGFHERLPHMYGGYPRMTNASIDSDLQERGRYSGSSSNSSGQSPSHSTAPLIPGKIPPPHIMKRWRDMSNDHLPSGSFHKDSSSVRGEGEYRWRRGNFVAKEGNLRRSGAFRTQKIVSEGDIRPVWRGRKESEDSSKRGNWRIVRDDENGQLPSVPLKQSRHYRKIELQAETPLFERDDDEDSSDEELSSIVSESTGKSSPGVVPTSSAAKLFHGRDLYHSPLATLEEHGRKRNYSGPPTSGRSIGSGYPSFWSRERLEKGHLGGSGGGSWIGSGSRLENSSPFGDEAGKMLPRRPNFLSRFPPLASESTPKYYSLESLEKQLQEERDGTYCQVTVGMRNENAVSGITSRSTGISNEKLDNILRKSQHSSVHSLDYNTQLPSPVSSSTYDDEICEEKHFSDNFVQLSPPLSPLEDFELPARESESFLYRSSGSMKSPVDDIIAPPLSFDDVHITPSHVAHGTITEEEEPQSNENNRNRSEPQNSKSSGEATDRNSTESYSSGYTSGQGQSPGISEMMNLATVDEFSATDLPSPITNEMKSPSPIRQDTLSELSSSISSAPNSHSGYSTRHSQTSYTSTDSIRFYVPFVFQKSRKSPKREITPSKTSLLLVVCLVENSENLIKELRSHKLASGYYEVECEEEEGKSVVSAGDDFTVETALEDLEFGFSIVKSTQKDVYINRAKVREFHFQIDNLFGCSGKPFSCDVEIRHADQITVLPIEIQYHYC